MRNKALPSVLLTLTGLAIVFTTGLTFVTIEFERLLERTLTPFIRDRFDAHTVQRAIFTDVEGFMRAHHVRLIGYACLGALTLLVVVGLLADKQRLSRLGSVALFMPTFGYFVIHMSFLAGLGILKALWLPFWGNLVKLGDIVYVPYMLIVYPCAQLGWDVRRALANALCDVGLLIFTLGTLAWFYARLQGKGTADFWIYRFSRHPQYGGWILWSYGLMLRAAQRTDVPLWDTNPGASLPWLLSTLTIICVALGEEIKMRREHGPAYEAYRARAPFLCPVPRVISAAVTAPLRRVLHKPWPENRRELCLALGLYAAILVSLSLPFVLLNWPPGRGWMDWPLGL